MEKTEEKGDNKTIAAIVVTSTTSAPFYFYFYFVCWTTH